MRYSHPASLACQVRAAIRFKQELPYQTFADIFKGKIEYQKNQHQKYLLAFFEECYPSLIQKFMKEQGISRSQILGIFSCLPELGVTVRFREALANGEF